MTLSQFREQIEAALKPLPPGCRIVVDIGYRSEGVFVAWVLDGTVEIETFFIERKFQSFVIDRPKAVRDVWEKWIKRHA